MAVNSKNKGSSFERKISNLFSKRFEEVTGKETAFRRNADSGSFFGGSNQRRAVTHDTEKATFGDIICPSNFAYSIECKHYKTPPTFASILKQDCKFIDEWISQGTQDANQAEKKLLVIAKFNLVPEMVIVVKGSVPLEPTITYKDYWFIPLADFLNLPDTAFFD